MRRRAAQKAKEQAIVPKKETIATASTEKVIEQPVKKAVKANGINKSTNK